MDMIWWTSFMILLNITFVFVRSQSTEEYCANEFRMTGRVTLDSPCRSDSQTQRIIRIQLSTRLRCNGGYWCFERSCYDLSCPIYIVSGGDTCDNWLGIEYYCTEAESSTLSTSVSTTTSSITTTTTTKSKGLDTGDVAGNDEQNTDTIQVDDTNGTEKRNGNNNGVVIGITVALCIAIVAIGIAATVFIYRLPVASKMDSLLRGPRSLRQRHRVDRNVYSAAHTGLRPSEARPRSAAEVLNRNVARSIINMRLPAPPPVTCPPRAPSTTQPSRNQHSTQKRRQPPLPPSEESHPDESTEPQPEGENKISDDGMIVNNDQSTQKDHKNINCDIPLPLGPTDTSDTDDSDSDREYIPEDRFHSIAIQHGNSFKERTESVVSVNNKEEAEHDSSEENIMQNKNDTNERSTESKTCINSSADIEHIEYTDPIIENAVHSNENTRSQSDKPETEPNTIEYAQIDKAKTRAAANRNCDPDESKTTKSENESNDITIDRIASITL